MIRCNWPEHWPSRAWVVLWHSKLDDDAVISPECTAWKPASFIFMDLTWCWKTSAIFSELRSSLSVWWSKRARTVWCLTSFADSATVCWDDTVEKPDLVSDSKMTRGLWDLSRNVPGISPVFVAKLNDTFWDFIKLSAFSKKNVSFQNFFGGRNTSLTCRLSIVYSSKCRSVCRSSSHTAQPLSY